MKIGKRKIVELLQEQIDFNESEAETSQCEAERFRDALTQFRKRGTLPRDVRQEITEIHKEAQEAYRLRQ